MTSPKWTPNKNRLKKNKLALSDFKLWLSTNTLVKNRYDALSRRTASIDQANVSTSDAYDALGRVLTRTLPLGQVETSSYDALGNLITHTDFNGDSKTFAYDVNNRVTSIAW